MDLQQMVTQFHRHVGADIRTVPQLDVPHVTDRLDLIGEEHDELVRAILSGDVIATADAIADLVYTAVGAAVQFGIPFAAVFAEVHRSNMTKEPGSGNGKAIKGASFSPADVAGVLERHAATAGGTVPAGQLCLFDVSGNPTLEASA